MTSVLVTGAGGMLGQDLVAVLALRPELKVTALARAELDLASGDAVREAVTGQDVVFNAAAWTDVDGAEADEAAATLVNGTLVAGLASACAAAGARLLTVSTDYVFAGDADTPYAEDAPTAPLNAYGRSKAVGERAVLGSGGYVVRTAWLYGRHGPNFAATMLRLAGSRDTLDVVDDQRGQPTWTWALAERLADLASAAVDGTAPAGVYHGTCAGETTWCGFARAVFEECGLDPARIRPPTSDAFRRPAPRPAYSVLGHEGWSRAGLAPMAPWRDTLRAAVAAGALPRP